MRPPWVRLRSIPARSSGDSSLSWNALMWNIMRCGTRPLDIPHRGQKWSALRTLPRQRFERIRGNGTAKRHMRQRFTVYKTGSLQLCLVQGDTGVCFATMNFPKEEGLTQWFPKGWLICFVAACGLYILKAACIGPVWRIGSVVLASSLRMGPQTWKREMLKSFLPCGRERYQGCPRKLLLCTLICCSCGSPHGEVVLVRF